MRHYPPPRFGRRARIRAGGRAGAHPCGTGSGVRVTTQTDAAARRGRALGAFDGLALGDALGMPTQDLPQDQMAIDYGTFEGLRYAGPHRQHRARNRRRRDPRRGRGGGDRRRPGRRTVRTLASRRVDRRPSPVGDRPPRRTHPGGAGRGGGPIDRDIRRLVGAGGRGDRRGVRCERLVGSRFAAGVGGDTDTIAAICGAVPGSVFGAQGWPAGPVATLTGVNRLRLEPLVDGLLSLRDAGAVGGPAPDSGFSA